ncbi:MAG TPA: hypothetical protein VFJ94_01440 [Intrasporangium sp.]|uniref:hypothetical protein n=1 Tax=Intrasporangium sp. TaxID=1925024 RepID=UPI002D772450|nr:hypothetical protein [Intrasporangium sp.]HET7397156.1 hypothetical protein [Intrasporangium sp.]
MGQAAEPDTANEHTHAGAPMTVTMPGRDHTGRAGASPRRRPRPAIWWAGWSTTVAGLVALGMAVTTPPRSGPWCTAGCVASPYTDAAAYVPRDYLWMYPAVVLALLFLALSAAVLATLPPARRAASGLGLALATLATGTLVTDYAIQLAVLQPSLAKGELEGLGPLSQYNPHGVFIALEDVGYAAMALAFVVTGAALGRRTTLERWVRRVLVGAGAMVLAGLAATAVIYGTDLDYRFEVFAIFVTWLTLIVLGVPLARLIRRAARVPSAAGRVPRPRPGPPPPPAGTTRPTSR